MSKISVFSQTEQDLLHQIKEQLKQRELESELSTLVLNEMAVLELSKAISLYPSILKSQSFGQEERNFDTLLESLLNTDFSDLIFRLPSKALLGKSFSVAKINFFLNTKYIIEKYNLGENDLTSLHQIISQKVFTLLMEEILLAILSDKDIGVHIRTNAGYFLMNIWEYRIDYGVRDFAPIMNRLWKVRDNLEPAFGTLMGMSELYQLAEKWDPILLDFLQRDDITEEEMISLSEFLFDMSYESIQELSQKMAQDGKSAIDKKDIAEYQKNELSDEYGPDDPRHHYRSYRNRKVNSINRARRKSYGPKKTFEEYLICFLLGRPDQWITV
jgi:hypothetical protein